MIPLVWSDLYKTIDMVHDGFYTRVSQKYGNILNEKELQLCCLLKAPGLFDERD